MSITTKSIIAVGAAAFLALAGAVSTADAGRGGGGKGGGGKGGGGGFKGVSIHHMGGGGAKFRSGGGSMAKFHSGGSKFKGYSGGGNFKSYGKKHAHGGKGHGKHVQFRRFGYYPWYGLYTYGGGGCGWLYRQAVATGSDYWWNRYYQCTGSYY
jgi:hypothetical protein